jgi:transposase-like protein
MDKRTEIISVVERRRHWPADEKLRIMEEALAPGAVIASVADRNGVCPPLLYTWLRPSAQRSAAGHFPHGSGSPCLRAGADCGTVIPPPVPALPPATRRRHCSGGKWLSNSPMHLQTASTCAFGQSAVQFGAGWGSFRRRLRGGERRRCVGGDLPSWNSRRCWHLARCLRIRQFASRRSKQRRYSLKHLCSLSPSDAHSR